MNGFLLGLALLALAPCLPAITTYSVDNTGGTCVASKTISASDSGMTSAHYAVTVLNSGGTAVVPTSQYGHTIDTSTYALTLTFGSTYFPSGYCGKILLRGVYGSADTSSTDDWKVTVSGAQINIGVHGAYSQRTVSGVTYASDLTSQVGATFTDDCRGEDYVYFAPGTGQLTVASDVDVACINAYTNINAAVTYGTGFPSGSVSLFRVANTGTSLIMDGDFRPW